MARKRAGPTGWAAVQRRGHLSAQQVQMAQDLGLSPRRLLANIASRRSEPWKIPTGMWIEQLWAKQHGRTKTPDEA
jgi:hypothetical protein